MIKVPLNITASEGTVYSIPLNVFSRNLYLNIQFFYDVSGEAAEVKLQQSLDGGTFDPVTDLQNEDVFIELNPSHNSATLNLVAFFTPWLKLQFIFPSGISGVINYIIIVK